MVVPAVHLAPALLVSLALSIVISRLLRRWPAGRPLLAGNGDCAQCGGGRAWLAEVPGVGLGGVFQPFPCGHLRGALPTINAAVLVGGSAALVFLHRGAPWPLLVQSLLLLHLLYPLAVFDLLTLTVDTRLVLIGLALRAVGLAVFQRSLLLPMVGGMFIGAGLFTMVELMYRTARNRMGLGEGDTAVMGLIGFFVGWQGVLPVVGLAALSGLMVGFPLLLLRREPASSTPIPFVPFLAAAGMAVFLLQNLGPPEWLGSLPFGPAS